MELRVVLQFAAPGVSRPVEAMLIRVIYRRCAGEAGLLCLMAGGGP